MASYSGLFCTLIAILVVINGLVGATKVFKVGDEFGWRVPLKNNTSFYGQWASRNRFQVGDSLLFEYRNDSVIEVNKYRFYNCDPRNPVIDLTSNGINSSSVVKLDRPGFFYFISGNLVHCSKGQRLIVEVMGVRHHNLPRGYVAAPPGYGDGTGPSPQPNAGTTLVFAKDGLVSLGLVVFAIFGSVWFGYIV